MALPELLGIKVHLNTTTSNLQRGVRVEALGNGDFVAVWEDYSATGPDRDGTAIRGQIFQADGTKKGGEFVVNSTTQGGQFNPGLAVLRDGHFVVAWEDSSGTDGDTSQSGVRARIFNPDGSAADLDGNGTGDGDFRVNTTTLSTQFEPSVAALSNGGFVVSFTSYNADGSNPNILSQAYDAARHPLGGEVVVNTTTADRQKESIALGWGSGYTVFYTDYSSSPDDPVPFTLRGRILTPEGGETKAEFLVPAAGPGRKGSASAAALTDGRYVVTWTAESGDGSDLCVKAQIFQADGTKVGGEFLINTVTEGPQMYSIATALPQGGFAITYNRIIEAIANDPGRSEIYVAVYDAAGNHHPGGDVLVGSVNLANHEKPDITTLADGRLVIAWEDPTAQPNDTGGGVYAQIVDPRGGVVSWIGTEGDDVHSGSAAADEMDGRGGHDALQGLDGSDTLIGGSGNDTLDGGTGADRLVGGTGDDAFLVTAGDTIVEAAAGGRDTIVTPIGLSLAAYPEIEVLKAAAGTAPVTLGGSDRSDTLVGNAGANTLAGGTGSDTMQGGLENDRLSGNEGDDRLHGGLGKDVLTGNTGKDVFVFDTKSGKANVDRITDFKPVDDTIWLDDAVFKKVGKGTVLKPGKLKKDFFTVGSAAKDATDHIIYDKAKGVLSYDVDGNGVKAAVQIATLSKKLALTYKDFLII